MKENRSARVKGLVACIIVLAAAFALGMFTKVFSIEELREITFDFSKVLKIIIMASGIIAAEKAIALVLSFIKPKRHRLRSVLSIVISLMSYVAGLVIICWALSIIGVNVSTIVASVGIVALVVGFSAESLIADVVTGAFMLFENQYNVGDIVEVDGFRGTVTNIGIRTTSITDPGDNVKIVNNSAMRNILNRSDKLSRSVSDISVPYSTDLEKLEEQIPQLMQEIFEKNDEMMKSPPRYLGVQSLGDSAVVLRFVVDVSEKDIYSCARVLNHDLLLGFRKLGVECPFPQLDVHTN